MTYEEVSNLIAQVGIPYAYYQFPEGTAQPTPFICFYYPGLDGFHADNGYYAKLVSLNIELYTDEKDFELEARLESILDEHEMPYRKLESYIDSEKMLMQTYESEVYING